VTEFLPLLFGLVAGCLAGSRTNLRTRGVLVVGIALGPLASWINGELAESAWLVLFDIAQVAAAFAMASLLARRLQTHRRVRLDE
jgi:hypothetical protein